MGFAKNLLKVIIEDHRDKKRGIEVIRHDLDGSELSKLARAQLNTVEERLSEESDRLSKARRDALAELGAEVDELDRESLIEDALSIARNVCGIPIGDDYEVERVKIDFKPLTKTGKVPKCIGKSTVLFILPRKVEVIVHAEYLSDAVPYKGQVHYWRGNKVIDYVAKIVNGELRAERV